MDKVTCNNCHKDLSTTTNSNGWRISLRSEEIPPHSGPVTDVYILPPIEEDLHFCGIGCLNVYLQEEMLER